MEQRRTGGRLLGGAPRLAAWASVFGLVPLPAVAESAVPIIAGRTTASGSMTSVMRVDVPASATVTWLPSDNPDVIVEGEGRFVGVVLTSDAPTLDGPTLVAGRIPMDAVCWPGRGCPVGPVVSVQARQMIDWNAGIIRVPAGRYLLYLIADGSPVSVTLQLRGLSGSIDLAPSDPAPIRMVSWSPEAPITASQSVLWDEGEGFDLGADTRGIMFSLYWLRGPREVHGLYGHCWHRGRSPDPGPACLPGIGPDIGAGQSITSCCRPSLVAYDLPPKDYLILAEEYRWPVQGMNGQEVWSVTAGIVDSIGGVGVWLPFGRVQGTVESYDLTTSFSRWWNLFPDAEFSVDRDEKHVVTKHGP